MANEMLEKLIKDKIESALKNSEHPKKFFITENGRGVTDGGDLYNALLKDVLNVVQVALVDILSEITEGKNVKEAVVNNATKAVKQVVSDNAGKFVKQAVSKVSTKK